MACLIQYCVSLFRQTHVRLLDHAALAKHGLAASNLKQVSTNRTDCACVCVSRLSRLHLITCSYVRLCLNRLARTRRCDALDSSWSSIRFRLCNTSGSLWPLWLRFFACITFAYLNTTWMPQISIIRTIVAASAKAPLSMMRSIDSFSVHSFEFCIIPDICSIMISSSAQFSPRIVIFHFYRRTHPLHHPLCPAHSPAQLHTAAHRHFSISSPHSSHRRTASQQSRRPTKPEPHGSASQQSRQSTKPCGAEQLIIESSIKPTRQRVSLSRRSAKPHGSTSKQSRSSTKPRASQLSRQSSSSTKPRDTAARQPLVHWQRSCSDLSFLSMLFLIHYFNE